MLDLHFQYALHTTSFVEQPISDKTLSRFRKRCYDYETISVFTEMYLNGVSDIPQLPFETVGLLLVFGFCHISLLYIKIERIDWFLYALTLCYLFCFDCGNSCLVKVKFDALH